jgi:Zn-dependent peptidase ImmA (M78 family)
MILHRRLPREMLENTATFDLIEKQAFYFAGAFLLPANEFSEDFFYPTLGELLRLKKKWGVAMAAALKRCQDLDLLPENEITRLWVAMGREGYRRREPLDSETEPEQPRLLRDSFELLINEGVRTKLQLKEALAFSESDVELLAGLPHGFFNESAAPAPVIELKARPARNEPNQSGGGRVVTFPKKGS